MYDRAPGQVHVIRVQPGEDVTCRARERSIDRCRLSVIFLAYPPGQMAFVFLNDRDAAIAATAVDDDVFEVGIVLAEDGEAGLLEKGRLV